MKLLAQRITVLLGYFTLALYLSGSLERGRVDRSYRFDSSKTGFAHNDLIAHHPYHAIGNDELPQNPVPVAHDYTREKVSRNGQRSAQPGLLPRLFDQRLAAHAVSNVGLFSDAKGWNRHQYYSTIQTVADGDSFYIVGRGYCGMYIYKYKDGDLLIVNECGIEFANTNGWGDVDHYSTIKATVANGSLYISGRGHCGMHIYKIVDNEPKVISMCEIKFSDEAGWNRPEYYSTIQTGAANGNLYLFGRGKCGIEMYQTWEDKIYPVSTCLIPFSDDLGWNAEKYYSTITSAVLYEHIYIIARAPCGIVIYRTLTGKKVELVNNCGIAWADATGWGSRQYYSTITAAADSTSVWISARSYHGMDVWRLVGNSTTQMNGYGIEFSNAFGWSTVDHYSTIGSVVADDILHIYGRSDCGMETYAVLNDGKLQKVGHCNPEWSNENGWEQEEYYSTIQGLAFDGFVVSGRQICGMIVWDSESRNYTNTDDAVIIDC